MLGLYGGAAIVIVLTHCREAGLEKYFKKRNNESHSLSPSNLDAEVASLSGGRKKNLITHLTKDSKQMLILIVLSYLLIGLFEGFVSGSLLGILASAIYQSAQLKMTAWLPFVYSLMVAVFNIASSYSLTGSLM